MKATARLLLLTGLWFTAVSCDEDSTRHAPGVSGILSVTLDAAAGNAGAILLSVTGSVDSVTAVSPYSSFATVSAQTANIVITGDLAPGELVHLWVPDLSGAASYQVTVHEVALKATFTLEPVQGYPVGIQPMP